MKRRAQQIMSSIAVLVMVAAADAFAEVESKTEQAQSAKDQDTSTQDSSELLQFEIEVAKTDLGCFLAEVDPVIRNLLTEQR